MTGSTYGLCIVWCALISLVGTLTGPGHTQVIPTIRVDTGGRRAAPHRLLCGDEEVVDDCQVHCQVTNFEYCIEGSRDVDRQFWQEHHMDINEPKAKAQALVGVAANDSEELD